MILLKLLHVASVIAWFGSALSDAVLEVVLHGTKSRAGRMALIELHCKVDRYLEVPAIFLALATGGVLFLSAGLQVQPIWMAKMVCGLAAAAVNLYCVKLVLERDEWAKETDTKTDLLRSPRGRRLSRRILATGGGYAFGVAALAITVVYLG